MDFTDFGAYLKALREHHILSVIWGPMKPDLGAPGAHRGAPASLVRFL